MQFWVRPFQRPWVIVCDGREGHDVLTRRAREFDRSSVFSDLFRAYVPESQVTFSTNNSWKYNRRLVSETMLPMFLSEIACKRAYNATLDLVSLWKQKARLAPHYTHDVFQDIHSTTADAIWAMTFGSDLATCKEQVKYLAKMDKISLPSDADKEITQIPSCSPPATYNAIRTLFDSSQISMRFGYNVHRLAVNFLPSLRRAKAIRDSAVGKLLRDAEKTFTKSSSRDVTCALELVVNREIATAAKEGRPAMDKMTTKRIHNELCLFLFAGATTIADTVSWGQSATIIPQATANSTQV